MKKSIIKIHDKHFETFISEDKIEARIKSISGQIAKDFKSEIPVFVVVLNGAFMFASELIKNFPAACELNFVKLSSYQGLSSSKKVETVLDIPLSVKGKSVIIVEDIIDTGNTLNKLMEMFEKMQVKQLKIASLFYKPEVYQGKYNIDYVGMEISNKFIVGYGLDYNQLGRNLTQVYKLKEDI